jgi:hypothetical protein
MPLAIFLFVSHKRKLKLTVMNMLEAASARGMATEVFTS